MLPPDVLSLPSRRSRSRQAALRSVPGSAIPSKLTSFMFRQLFVGPHASSSSSVRCSSAVHTPRNTSTASSGWYAIADGGWFGVGLGNGTLKWNWLPEAHNDFIFAVIAEELGVVGCVMVVLLFAVLAYTGLRIARRVDDPFRRLVATGLIGWLIGQAAINIGGVIGLLPITGLPLPFISDGGSALVVTMAAVGMLASFARAEPDAARALHARPPARWVRLLWAPLPPLPAPKASATKVATPKVATPKQPAGSGREGRR